MVVDNDLIEKVSKLSSLKISEEKKEKFKDELGDIIGFVENLNEIDVSSIDATFNTVEGGTPLRDDTSSQDFQRAKQILNNSPRCENGYFIVPKIIE